jgi:hypothetical protein
MLADSTGTSSSSMPCPCQEKEQARVKQLQKEEDDRKFESFRSIRRSEARHQIAYGRGPWDTERKITIVASKELREYNVIMKKHEKKWDEDLKSSNRFFISDNQKAEIHAGIAREKKNAEFVKDEELEVATSLLKEKADQKKDRSQNEENLGLHEYLCVHRAGYIEQYRICPDCEHDRRNPWCCSAPTPDCEDDSRDHWSRSAPTLVGEK